MPQLIHWSDKARADVRAIDRDTALDLLKSLARFVETAAGDVKQLHGFNPPRYRLRLGDWRVVRNRGGGAIEYRSRPRQESQGGLPVSERVISLPVVLLQARGKMHDR